MFLSKKTEQHITKMCIIFRVSTRYYWGWGGVLVKALRY
jgi:hypothetical protein